MNEWVCFVIDFHIFVSSPLLCYRLLNTRRGQAFDLVAKGLKDTAGSDLVQRITSFCWITKAQLKSQLLEKRQPHSIEMMVGTDAGYLVYIQPDFENVGQQKVDVIAREVGRSQYVQHGAEGNGDDEEGDGMDEDEENEESPSHDHQHDQQQPEASQDTSELCPWAIMV